MTKLTHFAFICLITGACIAPASGQTTLAPPATSASDTPSKTPAPATSTSSAAAEAFRIVPEDQLKQWWIGSKSNPAPKYPRDALRNRMQGCIAIAYAIHADGSATPIQLIKHFWTVHNPGIRAQFKQLLIRSISQWHYSPAPGNASRAPVLTYAVAAFTTFMPDEAPTPADREPAAGRMKAKCAVSDFAQDMQKLLGSPTHSSAAQ